MGIMVGVVAFLSELAMLAAAALVGWTVGDHVAGPVLGIVLAVVLVLTIATAWGLWLAPRARHRLPATPRLLAKCAVFAAVALAVAASSSLVWGCVLAIAGIGSAVLGTRFTFPRHEMHDA